MSEWIEFKRLNGNQEIYPTSIKVYGIEGVDKLSDGTTRIYMDDDRNYSYTLAEPYEEVMEKIKKMETPVKVITPVHFTHNECRFIYNSLSLLGETGTKEQQMQPILDKLKEILEEGEEDD